jgi:tetratricopeptide (TPR) repeat protein
MAYNKSKHIDAAQKHLSQGKPQQAIAEYQQVLKHDPTDQIILMTVGDLFVRKGETFQAIEYFERLAQVFTRDGFVAKAIAIYKKIAKLAPEETKPLEKLAELYVQQGVLSEARPIFLQLAEAHLKANRREPAAALLRKLLEAEPDNLRVQMRFADIQQAMGQTQDAAQTFLTCAERQIQNQQPAEAITLADRALQLAPDNVPARVVKVRALAAAGSGLEATSLLEQLPGVETNDEFSSLLLELYLEQNRGEEAAKFAQKIFVRDAKRYKYAHQVVKTLMDSGDADRALNLLGVIRNAMAGNGGHELLAVSLSSAAAKLPGRLEPQEWLVDLYRQLDDAVKLPGALSQLGQTAAASGNLQRAREAYEQLLALLPNDDTVRKNLDQIRSQLSLPPSDIPRAEPPSEGIPEQIDTAESFVDIPLDEETQKFVTLSLTDVDLFSSYGLSQKAVDLLEKVVARAPRHTGALEKLLDLSLGEGNSERTADLAAKLADLHTARGDSVQAEKFQELARRFHRAGPNSADADTSAPAAKTNASSPADSAPEFELPPPAEVSEDEAAALASSDTAEAIPADKRAESEIIQRHIDIAASAGAVREIDLSDEWAEISGQVGETNRKAGLDSIEFENAPAMARSRSTSAPFPMDDEPVAANAGDTDLMLEALTASGVSERTTAHSRPVSANPPSVIAMPSSTRPGSAREGAADYELELVETSPRNSAAAVAPSKDAANGNGLGDLSAELNAAIGPATSFGGDSGRGKKKRAEDSALAAKANAPLRGASDPGGPLSEIFQEFREQLDELQADEDPETHYNLGIAYREMGLLEEAISEFQKVAQAHDRGREFKDIMQCCTLLGLAFMEKGQPEIAAFWYERALRTPGLDMESILALRYDLGLAQELGGQADAALKSFQQVYAVNIDYRDVGERIASLRKQ